MVAILASSVWLAGCATKRQAQAPAGIPSVGPPQAAGTPAPSKGRVAEDRPPSRAAEDPSASPSAEGTSGRASAKTPDEQREKLDRDLDTSLSEFDAMLLKEQKEVAEKRAEQASAGGEGEGEGGQGEGGGGGTGSTGRGARGERSGGQTAGATETRSGSQERSGRRGKDQTTGSSSGGDRQGGGREVATAPEGAPAGDPSRVPTDVGDGRDDDVVARQLREAAINEEDPRIREKLWEEYRRYKRSES